MFTSRCSWLLLFTCATLYTVVSADVPLSEDSSLVATSPPGYKGTPVKEGNFSFVVSVRVAGKHANVGVIISPEYVLTEAYHYGNSESDVSTVSVVSGSVDVVNKGTIHVATRVVPHPKYNFPHFDIALIKVSPPFVNEEIAQLPEENQTWTGDAKTLAWGGFQDDVLTALKVAEVKVLPDDECATWDLENWSPLEQICVASHDLTSGLCDGDYGAPLVVDDSVIAGINIYNFCGANSTQLDRFIDISQFLEWIEENKI